MAKEQAVRVNLRTQAQDILATMREELPKAYYFFRKQYGGKQKYLKHEDQMLDKALEEKNDQFTDIGYWISRVGNRWMTYTQAQYFPKAIYANAFHYAFIYYETLASCGAFFPLYSQKQLNKGKSKKDAKPEGVILYTDHFFYQLSERTKIEYRSKELIRKFVSSRLENAMAIYDDGEVIVKFKGGYGFGKEYKKRPQYIAIRTFLKSEELNGKQRKMAEPVDSLYELIRDGAMLKDVALDTALLQDPLSKETIKENTKKIEAIKKMGLEKHWLLNANLSMIFAKIIEDILHMELNSHQQTIVTHIVSYNATEFVKKWVNEDSNGREEEFKKDMVNVFVKSAKEMKLKSVNRDSITWQLEKMYNQNNKDNGI